MAGIKGQKSVQFTPWEDDFLCKTINTLTVCQQAMRLSRTESSVAARRRRLGLKADKTVSQPLSLDQHEARRRELGYKSYGDYIIGEGLR